MTTAYTQTVDGTDYTINVKTDWKWDPVLREDKINFSDFNRIESNTIELRNYLTAIAYTIPSLTTVTDRTKTYIELLTGINRIEDNLETIRTNFFTPPDYLGEETWTAGEGFDYTDANRIEQNILDLFLAAGLVYDSYIKSGTIQSGYARGSLVVS